MCVEEKDERGPLKVLAIFSPIKNKSPQHEGDAPGASLLGYSMSSRVTPQHYGQAVLENVQGGAYPESEDVISAELPPSALPEVSKLIEQAREDVKATIRQNSRESAPDVDGWISQAKLLRVDIQRSQEIAREIVEQARQGEHLEEQVNDAASKVDLLNGELAFNKGLGGTLERLQAIQRTLVLIQRVAFDNRLLEAVDLLSQVDGDLESISIPRSTRVAGVLGAKIADLRGHVIERLTECWNSYVKVDTPTSSITITWGSESDNSSTYDMTSLIKAMSKLQLFDDVLIRFCKDFESLILFPRLQVRAEGTVGTLKIDGQIISMSGQSSDLSAQALFSDLDSIITFLRSNLPPAVVRPLPSLLMPHLISRLISIWLASAVPEDLDGMEDFEDTLSLVEQFGATLDTYGWPGREELVEWARSIPNVWIRKRQETSLNNVRILLSKGLGTIETVERVETQVLSRNDEVFAGNGGGEDWNAGWSDEESASLTNTTHPTIAHKGDDEDEEDVSAWGLDHEKEDVDADKDQEQSGVADDEAEAWGWGDEKEDEESKKPSKATNPGPKKPKSNGIPDAPQQSEREVTLKETYNITSLPQELLEAVAQIISDSERLENSDHANSSIAAAAPNLLSLPGLILAMYRASGPSTYSHHPSGPMFLYNDCLWLAERLQQLPSHQTTSLGKLIQSRTAYNLNLDSHIQALETFGKRAYAKELETQRTIITDLLDGAQGFRNCTEYPYNQDCDVAVASTVDRLRDLNKQWKGVLSQSALSQSLGSLLSTITNKTIIDIEEMSDISEPESQQLTTYCNRIAALEDLFLPTKEQAPNIRPTAENDEQEPVPLTALYTPHWLKFRYLANILESSLVDIKYLWTEGELGLEFDTAEVTDLIVALFADSPHRRNAIAEIRRRRDVR